MNSSLLKRITNIAVIALAAIGIVFAFAFIAGMNSGLDISFYLVYVMIFLVALIIIGFTIAQIVSTRQSLIRTLILLGVAVVIILIAFLIAPSELSEVAQRVGVSTGVYKWAGTLMNITYIMFFGFIVALIGSLIYTKIKK